MCEPTHPDGYSTITLASGETVKVDPDDYGLVSRYRWSISRSETTAYARANVRIPDGTRRTVSMHRMLMDYPQGEQVDHVNGDGLDNRKDNLRIASRSQNCANARPIGKSPYRGVSPLDRKWRAEGRKDGKAHYLGSFPTQEDAARAYDAWAVEHHGEFARLNFPEEHTP